VSIRPKQVLVMMIALAGNVRAERDSETPTLFVETGAVEGFSQSKVLKNTLTIDQLMERVKAARRSANQQSSPSRKVSFLLGAFEGRVGRIRRESRLRPIVKPAPALPKQP